MSYKLTLQCGCVVRVATQPNSRMVHTRVIDASGASCGVRRHQPGLRLYLWEMLPDRTHRTDLRWSDVFEDVRWST